VGGGLSRCGVGKEDFDMIEI
jgi:hypothetical protein